MKTQQPQIPKAARRERGSRRQSLALKLWFWFLGGFWYFGVFVVFLFFEEPRGAQTLPATPNAGIVTFSCQNVGIVTYSLTLGLFWGFPWLSPIYLALWAPLSLCLFLLLLLLKEEREEGEGHSQPEEPRGVQTPPQIRRLGIPANALIGTS